MATNSVSVSEAARLLLEQNDITILTHKNPDGDTLGSGFALAGMLAQVGKRASLSPSGAIPKKYSYMSDGRPTTPCASGFVVAVDIAAVSLVDDEHKQLCANADLCIDHHTFNEGYAKNTLVDSDAAACCEIIYALLEPLGARLDEYTAKCLYTGISTDTGCFRYRNTTEKSHLITAKLMETGFDMAALNLLLFEQKSRSCIELERLALSSIEFFYDDRVAIITITQRMLREANAGENDIEGITPLPRMIDGVEAGVTMRELPSGFYKVSLRTNVIDASAICRSFGGGGHKGAAGFECSGNFDDIKLALLAKIGEQLAAL